MADHKSLTAKDVRVGEALPILDVDVSATTIVLGALASRDFRPMHHDKDFAQNQGVENIFLNTPNQAAWFERYFSDWAGPLSRPISIVFKMKASVLPGDTMTFNATVTELQVDDGRGIGVVTLNAPLTVGEKLVTGCTAKIAVPASEGDNPWRLKGKDWQD